MTVYYVKSNGNDTLDGTSEATAWQTLAKVSATTFANGDSILFQKGATFYGQLTITKSSVSGSAITYGAFGTGAKPIISGFQELTGWTLHATGIYKTTGVPNNCGIVTVNGINTPMGKFPQVGYNTFETSTGRTSFVDNQLTNSPNFTGAEVVIKKSNWILDRSAVTNHTNSTVTYTSGSSYNPDSTGEYKYFFQKHLNCLLKFGDWFCDGTNFYMFFGGEQPENYTIKAGIVDDVVYLDRKNYNTLSGLIIEGGNINGINCISSTALILTNCEIKNCGLNGATYVTNGVTGASTLSVIDTCIITEINGTGILLDSAGSTIKDSTFLNIGINPGMGDPGGSSYIGMHTRGANNITEYNTISNTGYIGIYFYGNGHLVRYNKVDGFCKLGLDDGAAIYSYYGREDNAQSGMKVYNNIVLNSTATGLYPDNLSCNQEWYNNTVINVSKYGLHSNMPVNCNFHDNTFFGFGLAAFDIQNLTAQTTPASGNTIAANICIQNASAQNFFSFRDNRTAQLISVPFGASNNNTFIQSSAAADIFYAMHVLPSYAALNYDFTEWKALTSQEAASLLLTKDLSKISVLYNATKTAKAISLPGSRKDLTGIIYTSSITLQPFTAVVLESYASKYCKSDAGKFTKDSTGKLIIN